MKKVLLLTCISFCCSAVFAQKIDSISFHLYTDSLKKGRHNYINIDGKMSNGRWQPLTSKEIFFTASIGEFEGNDLVLPANMKEEKVRVKAVLKEKPDTWKEITIWIKTLPEPDRLPTTEEILNQKVKKKRRN